MPTTIYAPDGPVGRPRERLTPPPPSLGGLRIGVLDNRKPNAGLGAFGPGCRANATVGRAVRLVLLHVAGARPGPGDASTQGQPAKYAYCVGENVEASPWEPYHAFVDSGANDRFGHHHSDDSESLGPHAGLAVTRALDALLK